MGSNPDSGTAADGESEDNMTMSETRTERSCRRVFAALDGSEDMRRVAVRAARIAEDEGAALRFGHVVDALPADASAANHDALAESVKQRLREELADVLAQATASTRIPSVELHVAAGPVKQTLTERLIAPWSPDVVICGSRGLSKLRYAMLGSVSAHLVRTLRCNVLVVK